MKFNLIVPSKVEQEITGFLYAGERILYGKPCRIEAWKHYYRVIYDGKEISSHDAMNKATKNFANFFLKYVDAIQKMA